MVRWFLLKNLENHLEKSQLSRLMQNFDAFSVL